MSDKGHGQNRFSLAAQGQGSRPSIGQLRNAQRAEVSRFNDPHVMLPNPTARAPFDRVRPQAYESKVQSLGLAPNTPEHFWQFLKGDSGAGSSVFRRVSLFQLLAAPGDRVASTPYSQAIQIATMRSRDQRPKYFQVSLFSVGRIFESQAPIEPEPDDEITRFAPGIPQGIATTVVGTQVARGVPLVSTTTFRVMFHDESGQRFIDVDAVGTRSINVYAWGVTVFAMIKQVGYEIDRQVDTNAALTGMVDQSVVGARIIPIRSNFTQNVNNRTVTVNQPADIVRYTVPIPPGAKTVQIYSIDGAARYAEFSVRFEEADPLALGVSAAIATLGEIDPEPGKAMSAVYQIPNANSIVLTRIAGANPALWSLVFEETP